MVLVEGNCYHESYCQQLWERWGRWLVTIKPQAFDEMARVISLSHIIVFTPHDLITNQAKCPLEVIEAMAICLDNSVSSCVFTSLVEMELIVYPDVSLFPFIPNISLC
ncbi:MAG: hypothetical protein NZM30_00550 [Geminocystis sp.]|nr:hypothetical protein [Geminocystis sp.]